MGSNVMQNERDRLRSMIEAEERWISRTPGLPHHHALANIVRWQMSLGLLDDTGPSLLTGGAPPRPGKRDSLPH